MLRSCNLLAQRVRRRRLQRLVPAIARVTELRSEFLLGRRGFAPRRHELIARRLHGAIELLRAHMRRSVAALNLLGLGRRCALRVSELHSERALRCCRRGRFALRACDVFAQSCGCRLERYGTHRRLRNGRFELDYARVGGGRRLNELSV